MRKSQIQTNEKKNDLKNINSNKKKNYKTSIHWHSKIFFGIFLSLERTVYFSNNY